MVRVIGLSAIACGLAIGTGCGRCKGGIRSLQRDTFEQRASFVVWGDGPGSTTSGELRELSGIDESTLFVEGPMGTAEQALVDLEVGAAWGGHSCMNGVTFGVTMEDLPPGDYEAVLLLDALDWPFLGDEDDIEQRDGEDVLIGRVTFPLAM